MRPRRSRVGAFSLPIDRVVLLNKRPALYARLMLRMWYNQADMMPNYRMMLRKRVEAFTHG